MICSNCGEKITAGLERRCNYCNQPICTKCRLPENHACGSNNFGNIDNPQDSTEKDTKDSTIQITLWDVIWLICLVSLIVLTYFSL